MRAPLGVALGLGVGLGVGWGEGGEGGGLGSLTLEHVTQPIDHLYGRKKGVGHERSRVVEALSIVC